jgi:hypothetical protein
MGSAIEILAVWKGALAGLGSLRQQDYAKQHGSKGGSETSVADLANIHNNE